MQTPTLDLLEACEGTSLLTVAHEIEALRERGGRLESALASRSRELAEREVLIRDWVRQQDAEGDGVRRIAAERRRQVEIEGWSATHDDGHDSGELAAAAACYAVPAPRGVGEIPEGWPFAAADWKPSPLDRISELAKAGALLAAEIDRIQRSSGGEVR